MNQQEKAERYDMLVREGDIVNAKISKLKSQNAGVNTKTPAYEKELKLLENKIGHLENEVAKLF